MAYADPPYLGCSRYYDHPDASKWDDQRSHGELLSTLDREYDGWAFSLSSTSLAAILPYAPPGTRIGSWCKSFAAYKRNVRIAYAWEPVLFKPARDRSTDGAQVGRDFLVQPITLSRGLVGAKPDRFCRWVLDLMGYVDGDSVEDLFPGTGVMGKVVAQGRLTLP